ncbi:MAG: hypothetical protein QXI39_07665 [Candidatus Bathyarchaeia archaeon]
MNPYGAGSIRFDRFGSLSEAFYLGRAGTAVVDERTVNLGGLEAWIWIALEPVSRRILALELSWTRSNLTAYLFLKKLRDLYGVRVIVANGAPWYGVASELGLRLIHDRSLLNLAERLSKELKRRLKDFSSTFTSHANAKSPSGMLRHGLKPGRATITT